MENFQSIQETLNSVVDASLNSLFNFKTTQETYNSSNDTNISNLENFQSIQETLNSNVSTNLDTLNTFQTSQTTKNTAVDSSLNTLFNFKTSQELYDASNNINISDLQSFKTSQENYNLSNDTNISTLNAFVSNQEIYNTDNDTNISTLTTFKSSQEILNISVDASLSSLQAHKTNQLAYNLANDDDISELMSFKTSQQTYNSTNDGNLNTINNSLLTKQEIINASNKLPISYINLGVSSLSFVDITSSLNEKLTLLDNKDTSHDNSISSINSAISTLQSADVIHDNQISALETDITNLETSVSGKQDVIDVNNLLPATLIQTDVNETLDERIISIENSIDTKQDEISISSKLPISFVDLSGSSLSYIDISSNLQAQLTSINNAISTLEGLQQGDITSFQTIQDNFDTLETLVNSKQNILNGTTNKLPISYVDLSGSALNFVDITSPLQAQLDNLTGGSGVPSISYDAVTSTTTISNNTNVTKIIFSGDSSEQITAFTTAKNTQLSTNTSNITSINGRVTIAETNITTNTNAIALKQDALNDSTNKLPLSHVDLTGTPLSFVDISSSLDTQLSDINSAISALQTSDNGQTTSITDLTNSVNTLTNTKQDVISGSNLVSSQYVSYNATNVKTELDAINTSLSSKANTSSLSSYAPINNPTFTGTISGITKSMVGLGNVDDVSDADKPVSSATQTALNLKANLSAPIFTNFVQVPRIFENIQSTWTSFSSNILTFNYANGSILFFNGLTSATNFNLTLTNVNPNNDTNESFTFSLIIDTATHKAYANTITINGTNRTLRSLGGSLSVNSSSVVAIQTFTIIFTNSSSVPTHVITNLASYW